MPRKAARWIGRVAEFRPKEEVFLVPRGVRGIYVLFRRRRRKALAKRKQRKVYKDFYDVVYVGLSRSGIRARLKSHRLSRVKGAMWSHFSLFQVHARVSDSQIGELEGLFRQIYRRDSRANKLNVQKTHGPLKQIRVNDLAEWSRGE